MAHQAIIDFSSQLLKRWQEGDIEENYTKGLFNCPTIPNGLSIDSHYFECNSLYLECYIQNQVGLSKQLQTTFGHKSFAIKFNEIFNSRVLSRKYVRPTNEGVEVSVSIENISYDFLLKNTCGDSYLPQRKYAQGPYKAQEQFEWDNFTRNFYIDKYLVPHSKVIEWSILHQEKIPEIKKESWHRPSTILSKEQMKKFCHFHKSKLLKANLYDAASFIPFNEKEDNPILVKKSPFPWSKKKDLFNSLDNTYEEDSFSKKTCESLFSKDCLDQKVLYNSYQDSSVTWMGMFNPLGGPMEYMENLIRENKNLRLSSYYFPLHHKFNQIGVRGAWLGNKQEISNIKFEQESGIISDFIKEIKIGFRCYKELP